MSNFFRDILYRIRGNIPTSRLIRDGMKIGKNFHRMNDVWIDPGHCWLISVGDNVTLAPRVMLLAHDASLQHALHVTKVGNITLGNNVFIGAGTIILPGVDIGDNTIIGAGSVVRESIPANSIAFGNPAIRIIAYEDFVTRNKKRMEISPCFGKDYLYPQIDAMKKEKMRESLNKENGFLL